MHNCGYRLWHNYNLFMSYCTPTVLVQFKCFLIRLHMYVVASPMPVWCLLILTHYNKGYRINVCHNAPMWALSEVPMQLVKDSAMFLFLCFSTSAYVNGDHTCCIYHIIDNHLHMCLLSVSITTLMILHWQFFLTRMAWRLWKETGILLNPLQLLIKEMSGVTLYCWSWKCVSWQKWCT